MDLVHRTNYWGSHINATDNDDECHSRRFGFKRLAMDDVAAQDLASAES